MLKSNFDEIVNTLEQIADIKSEEDNKIVELGIVVDDDRWITYSYKYDCIIFYNLGQERLVIPRSSDLVDMLYSLFDGVFEARYEKQNE